MRAYILCGGRGVRLDYLSDVMPKALVKIGNKPILHHLIEIYLKNEICEFVLCLGYKKKLIISYFKSLKHKILTKKKDHLSLEIFLNKKKIIIHFVNTKLYSGTAGRINIAAKKLKQKDDFLMTYCDGLANINIKKLIRFHKINKKIVTVTSVRPRHTLGILKLFKNKVVKSFENGNPYQEDNINGGFFVINPKGLSYIKNNYEFWESEPMQRLIKKKKIVAYQHNGFWKSLDTRKDQELFNTWIKKKKILWI